MFTVCYRRSNENNEMDILKEKKDIMTQQQNELKDMPNQYWHRIISFIKSGIRIIGYAFIPFNLVYATVILIISEMIGIIEELV